MLRVPRSLLHMYLARCCGSIWHRSRSSSAQTPLLRKLHVYFKLPLHPEFPLPSEERLNQAMVTLQEALQSMPILSCIQRDITRLVATTSTPPKRTLNLIYPCQLHGDVSLTRRVASWSTNLFGDESLLTTTASALTRCVRHDVTK